MRVVLAENAGFCWGVKRVVNLTQERAGIAGTMPVYTYGPLIHNNSVIGRLREKGVRVLEADADAHALDGIEHGAVVIIRAHGITPDEHKRLECAGVEVVDGTCPHVIKIQKAVEAAHAAGRTVVIMGDKGHAEVAGVLGFCKGRGRVASSAEEVAHLDIAEPVTAVAQSTLDATTFAELTAAIRARWPQAEIIDTRCNATSNTQEEAIALCRKVDAMVVIGGRHSANTNRLAQLCREQGVKTIHVETADELAGESFKGVKTVGVTAGSSTPDWVIAEVMETLTRQS